MATSEDRGEQLAQPLSIVCLSSQDWDTALRTNRQQVMLRAARRGHRVLFVETGHFLGKHLWSLLSRGGRRSLARRLFATEEVAPGVLVGKALKILTWGPRFGHPKTINSAFTARRLRRIAATLPEPVVSWIYDPGAVRMAGSPGEEFAVYDCVDAYTRSCFPLKLYEYLAAGKPVVASGVPELAGMEPDVILADGVPAFVEAVQDAAAGNGDADRLRRKELAARNTWEAKTERLLELVQRELEAGGRTGE